MRTVTGRLPRGMTTRAPSKIPYQSAEHPVLRPPLNLLFTHRGQTLPVSPSLRRGPAGSLCLARLRATIRCSFITGRSPNRCHPVAERFAYAETGTGFSLTREAVRDSSAPFALLTAFRMTDTRPSAFAFSLEPRISPNRKSRRGRRGRIRRISGISGTVRHRPRT